MARGFRMGGAGASVAPQPVDDKFWIVKDGVVQIPFDSTVYKVLSQYNTAVQWAYSAEKLLYRPIPSANVSCAGLGSTSTIAFSAYSNLHVVGRLLQNDAWTEKDWSLANINGNYYLVISQARDSTGRTSVSIYASTIKDNYETNRVGVITVGSTTSTTTANYSQIKDLWLEKTGNLLSPINTLALTTPSSTTSASSTKRTWTQNSLVKGVNQNNSYSESDVTSYSISNNTLTMTKTGANSYGVGFVLGSKVSAGNTYKVGYTQADSKIYAVFYKSDGTFISNVDVTVSNGAFTVPSNTSYTLIECIMVGSAGTYTFTINGVTKATT